MAITEQQRVAWLKENDALRCILIETSYGTSQDWLLITDTGDFLATDAGDNFTIPSDGALANPIYISNVGYKTEVADTPSATPYIPIVIGGIRFTESLDLESKASLSFGDIEIDNSNGQYDEWLDYIWTNRNITVYFGDVTWDRADFFIVFDGVIDGISSKSRDILSIKVLDKLQRLNTPMSNEAIGGISTNKDNLKPITHGECFNVTPALIDDANLQYQANYGLTESFIEVRDSGVPVSYVSDLSSGTFTLVENPFGAITCSVQGDNSGGYKNTVADCVQNIAMNYGDVNKQFAIGDIDTANFTQFNIDNPQPVGLHASSRINCLSAINQLADSVGAQAIMSREGKLRLLKIELPPDATGTVTLIAPVDMVEQSLKISKRVIVKAAIKVGYCKNWTVQSDLQTGIPEEHKLLFADEWVYKVRTDSAVAAEYSLGTEPTQKDTLLLDDTDADNEAKRLLNIYREQRTIYELDGFASLIDLQLGDTVKLKHDRFGLSSGKNGMVVKMQIDWLKMQVKLGIIV